MFMQDNSNIQNTQKKLKKFNRIIHLTKDQKRQPKEVLADFFQSYHLRELRVMVRDWFDAAISSDYSVYEKGLERSNLHHLYQQIEQLIEASYIIHCNHQAKKEKEITQV
jgi:hypothetical protein